MGRPPIQATHHLAYDQLPLPTPVTYEFKPSAATLISPLESNRPHKLEALRHGSLHGVV